MCGCILATVVGQALEEQAQRYVVEYGVLGGVVAFNAGGCRCEGGVSRVSAVGSHGCASDVARVWVADVVLWAAAES